MQCYQMDLTQYPLCRGEKKNPYNELGPKSQKGTLQKWGQPGQRSPGH